MICSHYSQCRVACRQNGWGRSVPTAATNHSQPEPGLLFPVSIFLCMKTDRQRKGRREGKRERERERDRERERERERGRERERQTDRYRDRKRERREREEREREREEERGDRQTYRERQREKVFVRLFFIVLVQTTILLQDNQSRMNYSHVLFDILCPYQSSRLALICIIRFLDFCLKEFPCD